MTYYGAKELAESFRTVRKNTLTIAQDIGEQHYSFSAAPGTRTVAQMLVHIAVSPQLHEQIHAVERRTTLVGFDFPALFGRMMAEEQASRSKDQIIALLRDNGERWAKWLDGLSDAVLAETVSMPPGGTPPSRTRFDMLLSVKEHEMHHRGQLMLMERMVGIVPHLTRAMQERMAAAAGPTATGSRPS